MANFFKDYQVEVKAAKQAKESNTIKKVEYTTGQQVFINPMYDENRNGKRFFVAYLGNGGVLLAKTKKDAINGYGYIYSISVIIDKH